MKAIIYIVVTLTNIAAFAQESLTKESYPEVGFSIGQAIGRGEQEPIGVLMAASLDYPIWTKWLSFTGRFAGTYIQQQHPEVTSYTEKSNGVNLDAELSTHLRRPKVDFSTSFGITVRNSHVQQITGWATGSSGEIIAFSDEVYRGFSYGMVVGLNVDCRISEKLTLGARADVRYGQNQYSSITLVTKFRK